MTASPGIHLHVFLTRARNESRFLREAEAVLRAGLAERVVLAALWDNGEKEVEEVAPGVEVRRIRLRAHRLPKGLTWHLIRGMEWRARVMSMAREIRPVLLHAHSLYALSPTVLCGRKLGVPVIYDAHELETERCGLRGLKKRFEKRMERSLIRHCDSVVCVSDGIADWYAREYCIPRPAVIRNVPRIASYTDFEGSKVLRERFGIPEGHLIFLYQGALFRGRRIEQLLEVWKGVGPDRHLVLMGYGPMQKRVREAAACSAHIHHLEAVPPREVLRHTASADVGLCGVENTCLSYYLSLPNKLFEFIHAGIPCLAPDFPEMRRVLDGTGCGWLVGEGVETWRQAVNRIDAHAIAERRAGVRMASRGFTWEKEEAELLRVCTALAARNRQ